MMVIFKCVVPIFCAQSWIFLSSVSTEKNPRGSQAVNDRFSTGSSKQKKHSGVAGTVKTAPCVFFLRSPFPSIGALQLMRGRTVHPRIPEVPPAYVQRSLLLLTRASYPRAYIISTLTSTECSAIKSDRVLLNRGQT